MKKLFFIDPMSYGTIASYDYNLLCGVAQSIRSDFQVQYYCSFLNSEPDIQGVKRYPIFKYNNKKNHLLKFISYLLSLIRLLLRFMKERPDVAHIQWIRVPNLDYFFLRLFKFSNCKIIYTAHNVLPHNDFSVKTFESYRRYYKAVDIIIVHSENTRRELIDKFGLSPEKIVVIPHGLLPVTVENNIVSQKCDELKKRYALEGYTVISCLGVQSTYKGTDILINAWSNTPALRNNLNIRLLIAGKMKDISYSELQTCSNVVIIDRYLTDEEYIAFLRLSTATIFPYRIISQSGSLFTAINERVPIIVSHTGGLHQPLEIADIGWDFGSSTPENLKSQLIGIIQSGDFLAKRETARWDKIHNYYSWDRIGRLTAELYNHN